MLIAGQKWKCPFFETDSLLQRRWKIVLTPINKHFVFLGNFFSKKFQKNLDKLCVGWKVLEILEKNSSKKDFPKKYFFSKKTKCLFIRVKKFFSPPPNFFCKKLGVPAKLSVSKNGHFHFCPNISITARTSPHGIAIQN